LEIINTSQTPNNLANLSNISLLSNNWVNGTVRTIAVSGDYLYVGGDFSDTNDNVGKNLNKIAKYQLSSNTWSALSNNGLNSTVRTITVSGDYLYVGGDFSDTNDNVGKNLNKIAKYQLSSNTWSALSNNGLNSTVYTIAASGDSLYVGGYFSKTHFNAVTDLNSIAIYKISTNTWSALSNNGLNSTVRTIAAFGDYLYVGGNFSETHFNAVTDLNSIAIYKISTNTWSKLHNASNLYNAGDVNIIAASENSLYIGGYFMYENSPSSKTYSIFKITNIVNVTYNGNSLTNILQYSSNKFFYANNKWNLIS